MSAEKIKVLLVDDHAVVRAGFRMLLSAQDFVGEIVDVDRGEVVTQEYERFKPDVVVMDLSMPGIGGLEAIRRLVKADDSAVVLVYSIHEEPIYIERAMLAGAKGYVTKNSAPEILAEAVQAVVNGKEFIEEGLKPEDTGELTNTAEQYRKTVDTLSPREFDIFCLLANGKTAHDVADHLCLGYKTVANYSTQIKQKLKVSTAADLANIAVILGIIKHDVE
jgi:DNA-binding NarL/FixJ family response regulator